MNQLSLESINRLNPEDRVIIYFSALAFLTDSFMDVLKKTEKSAEESKENLFLMEELACNSLVLALQKFMELTDKQKSQMSDYAEDAIKTVVTKEI